jgi:transposase-like protein
MKFKKLGQETLKEIIEEIKNNVRKKCYSCQGDAIISLKQNDKMICTEKLCKKKFSLWKDTIFENSNLKKELILQILELWMMKASFDLISYILEVDRKSIWRLMKKVADIVVEKYYNTNELIGGENMIIEVDESKFGKRKYHRRHHVDGVWILGMVEKTGSKKIKLMIVDKRDKDTLNEKMTNSIDPNSTIYTDCWKGYNDTEILFNEHYTVNHSISFINLANGVHTNSIEGCWNGIKMHVPPRGRTKAAISLYLVRYMLLRNEESHPLLSLIKYLL